MRVNEATEQLLAIIQNRRREGEEPGMKVSSCLHLLRLDTLRKHAILEWDNFRFMIEIGHPKIGTGISPSMMNVSGTGMRPQNVGLNTAYPQA